MCAFAWFLLMHVVLTFAVASSGSPDPERPLGGMGEQSPAQAGRGGRGHQDG